MLKIIAEKENIHLALAPKDKQYTKLSQSAKDQALELSLEDLQLLIIEKKFCENVKMLGVWI